MRDNRSLNKRYGTDIFFDINVKLELPTYIHGLFACSKAININLFVVPTYVGPLR
jgi:hypothetical protein